MGPCVVIRGGVDGAFAGSCSIHVGADGGEGGGEMVECLVERGARVSDGGGNKLHKSPISPEGRDEGGQHAEQRRYATLFGQIYYKKFLGLK